MSAHHTLLSHSPTHEALAVVTSVLRPHFAHRSKNMACKAFGTQWCVATGDRVLYSLRSEAANRESTDFNWQGTMWTSWRRLKIAFGASALLNFAAIVAGFSINPASLPYSRLGRILDLLGKPAGAFTELVAPGHDSPQIAVFLFSSVLFYAIAAWIILAIPELWRNRT